VHDLRHPNPAFQERAPLSLVERHPVGFWKGLAFALALLEIATLWALLARG